MHQVIPQRSSSHLEGSFFSSNDMNGISIFLIIHGVVQQEVNIVHMLHISVASQWSYRRLNARNVTNCPSIRYSMGHKY